MKPLRNWDDLPDFMRTEEVRPYYDNLKKHEQELVLKRAFDVVAASILLVVLAPVMFVVAVLIKLDSPGPVFFRQTRITQYGKEFQIYKFRTMVTGADTRGSSLTVKDDERITKVGEFIRKYRVDEFPQLFNVLAGDMSFVGTRPEVKKYVDTYTKEMYATLLLPAGITSIASIKYIDEQSLLVEELDIDRSYRDLVLPKKMELNLIAIYQFSLYEDLLILVRTILAVVK